MDIKKQIIEVSNNLFYENGFNKTTYKHISEAIHISPGSISYHFDSKYDLGLNVYINYMSKYYQKPVTFFLYDKYGSIDPRLASSIEMRLQFHVFQNDKHVFRFYNELFSSGYDYSLSSSITFFSPLQNELIRNEKDKMFAIAAKGASISLATAYFNNTLSVSPEEYIDYKVKTVLELTGCRSDLAERYVKSSKDVISKMKINILPYFVVELSPQ